MREEEGDPRYYAITHSFVEDLDRLLLNLSPTTHSIWIRTQEAKNTTKHTSETSIIKCNPLNRSRSIKINEALTQEFMESEPTIVYINKQKRKHTIKASMLVSLLEWMFKSKLNLSRHSFSKWKWIVCRHYLSTRVQKIRYKPFGNGGEWIYRQG